MNKERFLYTFWEDFTSKKYVSPFYSSHFRLFSVVMLIVVFFNKLSTWCPVLLPMLSNSYDSIEHGYFLFPFTDKETETHTQVIQLVSGRTGLHNSSFFLKLLPFPFCQCCLQRQMPKKQQVQSWSWKFSHLIGIFKNYTKKINPGKKI